MDRRTQRVPRPVLRYGDANFLFLSEEGHHIAKALADGFELVGFGGFAHGEELELVEALEVSDFGGVAGFDQGFEPCPDELGGTAAEDSLFAEEVAFGFFAEGGVEDAGLE